ncbi:MAG: DUF4174 domain-containing protein [Rhodobacter sp.]|jgi:hypothetical protein|nr:DUF4174 domain-containing protein [Rhodobacter sp.]
MKQVLVIVFAMFLALPVLAQTAAPAAEAPALQPAATDEAPVGETPEATPLLVPLLASEVSLADLLWLKRPVVVFADTPADPRFQQQVELLLARPEELIARDVVIIIDADPAARSEIRMTLRPRGFMLTLIDKDGRVNLRKPAPWDVREITRAIDKWPTRKQEILEHKAHAADEAE